MKEATAIVMSFLLALLMVLAVPGLRAGIVAARDAGDSQMATVLIATGIGLAAIAGAIVAVGAYATRDREE